MSDEKTPNLEFKVLCKERSCLATLTFPEDREPRPTDFSCQMGLSYPAGVVCNSGGAPCLGYEQAIQLFQEFKKLRDTQKLITEKPQQDQSTRLQEISQISAKNPGVSTEIYRGFTICFQNPTEKRAYLEMIDRHYAFFEKFKPGTIAKVMVPTPSNERGLAHHNAQRSAM